MNRRLKRKVRRAAFSSWRANSTLVDDEREDAVLADLKAEYGDISEWIEIIEFVMELIERLKELLAR